MASSRKLPFLAEARGTAEAASNGYASIRRGELEGSQAALSGLRALAGDLRCALVTTTGAGDSIGVAIGLATAAAIEGRRVMLIECDLARPELARRLGLVPNPGLAEYLAWEATAQQILRPLDLSGVAVGPGDVGQLVCVAAGSAPGAAGDLLDTESFAGAMGRVRAGYELVVLAGAPIAAPELALIAAYADAVALCTPEERGLKARSDAVPELAGLRGRPVGIVRVGR
jgi:non-specific protein-tyrosine kinase